MNYKVTSPAVVKKIKQTKFIKGLLIFATCNALVFSPLFSIKASAASASVCPVGCDYSDMQTAVDGQIAGDTINVSGAFTITTTVNVNKPLTIQGDSTASISTSGTNNVFTLTAAGSVLAGIAFEKTDSVGPQNLIGIQANDTTVMGNVFTGHFVLTDGFVSRAVEVSPGVTGFIISGNSISGFRQPAYINDNASGQVTDNFVAGTKGWVIVSNSNVTFTDNTWGTGAARNINDIAIIAPGAVVNNYPDATVVAISDANNDAVIENQFGGVPVLSDVFVDDSATPGGNGLPLTPYQTITPALTRVVAGGTVRIADGSYNESFAIQKNGTKLVGESLAGVVVTSNGTTPSGYAIDITGKSGVSFSGITFVVGLVGNPGYHLKVYQSSDISLSNLVFTGRGSAYTPRTGGMDFNATYGVTMSDVTISGYSKNGVAVSAKYVAGDTASSDFSFSNVSVSDNAWHGFAFYNYNGSGTVSEDITGVSFSGSNASSNNGQTGLILAGATDPQIFGSTAPSRTVSGPASADLDISTLSFSGNPIDVFNYQSTTVEAIGSLFNGKTGTALTDSERTVQDAKLYDLLDNAALGLVHYYDPDTTAPVISFGPVSNPVVDNPVVPDVTVVEANAPVTYSWMAANAAYASIISNTSIEEPTFTPSADGTYEFYLTVTDPSGNASTETFSFTWKKSVPVTTTTTTTTSSTTLASTAQNLLQGSSDNTGSGADEDTQVLGAEHDGATTSLGSSAKDIKKSESNILGLAWYWWLIIVALVSYLLYMFARRRVSDKD